MRAVSPLPPRGRRYAASPPREGSRRLARRISSPSLLLLALAAGALPLSAQDHSGVYPLMDVQHGAELYRANCTRCHGLTGDGIPGVDLKAGIRRASTDEELGRLITTGIPGTAMPATRFSAPEVRMLVAYLRSMRDFQTRSVPVGDRARGRTLFEGKGGCTSCHRVGTSGSRAAPDLSAIGSTRPASSLWNSIVDPTRAMRPINRPVRLVTRDGDTIRGRRLNEDTYWVQIIDEEEKLRSLEKSSLREFTVLKQSTMPSYAETLTEQEIADLVSYLVSLKGEN
jgi:putative heme-binding domain-containing protein